MKEQRKEPRNAYIGLGKVCIIGPENGIFYDCKVANISTNGLSFYSDIKIDKEHLIKVIVNNYEYTCSIVWRNKVDDMNLGKYHYGMQIVGEIDIWSKVLL